MLITTLEPARAQRWIRAFGGRDLIAASALQPGLCWLETSYGAWPMRAVGGMHITLGGPLCDPGDRPAMIKALRDSVRRPLLFYLPSCIMPLLDDTGLYCTAIGVDRHVDVPGFIQEPAREILGACKQARRAGVSWTEVPLGSLDDTQRNRLREITASYVEASEFPVELRFLNRPMDFEDDGTRRLWLMEQEGRGVFGYAVANAIFHHGEIVGWLLDILRFLPSRVWGLWLSTVFAIAQVMLVEQTTLCLGFCPLHQVSLHTSTQSDMLSAQTRWMEEAFSEVAYFTHLRHRKSLIQGHFEPRWLASFTRASPVVVYAFVKAMGVQFRSLLGFESIRMVRERGFG